MALVYLVDSVTNNAGLKLPDPGQQSQVHSPPPSDAHQVGLLAQARQSRSLPMSPPFEICWLGF